MKKIILTTVAMLMTVIGMQAQQCGKFFVGGDISLEGGSTTTKVTVGGETAKSSENDDMSFTFSPEIGYWVTDNVGVGLSLSYTTTSSVTALGAVPFVSGAFPISEKVTFMPTVGAGIVHMNVDGNDATNSFYLTVKPLSLEIGVSRKVGLVVSPLSFDYSSTKVTDGLKYNKLSWELGIASIGLRLYF